MSAHTVEDRVIELEIRVAFQDKTLRELDEVVTQYAARIDALVRELDVLRARVDAAAEPDAIVDDRPPHY